MVSVLLSLVVSQAAGDWRLEWNAPSECTSGDGLSQRLERQLGRPLFGEPARRVLKGKVARADGEWRAVLTLADIGGVVLGSREVSTREPECAALDARMLLVMGLLVGPATARGPIEIIPAPIPELPADLPPHTAALEVEPTVLVHLEADREVHLVEWVAPAPHVTGRMDQCAMPCDKPLRVEGHYVVEGPNVVPAQVQLPAHVSAVTFRIQTGSLGKRTAGVMGVSLGGAIVLSALILLVVGGGAQSQGLVTLGGVGLPIGALGLGLGVWATATSRTIITSEVQP